MDSHWSAALEVDDVDSSGSLELSLAGADAALFSVDASSGALAAGADLSQSPRTVFNLLVRADDGVSSNQTSLTVSIHPLFPAWRCEGRV